MNETDLALNPLEKIGKRVLDTIGTLTPILPDAPCLEPDYPNSAIVLEVPAGCQIGTYTCGVISTWSIIQSLGYEIGIKEWSKRCHTAGCDRWNGMDIDQLRRALRTLDLKVKTHPYRSRDQVRRFLKAGQPILFGQGEEMFEGEGDHWMYCYGCSGRYVFVGNVVVPFKTRARWTWGRFEEELNPRELYLINC